METKQRLIFQLKIELLEVKPAVWRSVDLSNKSTFFDLHVAIQDMFGWSNSHLHQFFTASPFKRYSEYEIIGPPDEEGEENVLDESKIVISKYLEAQGSEIWYEYDFGDSWMHNIKLEKIKQPEPKVSYPQVLSGAEAAPPEDCGGAIGYTRLLYVLAHPEHPDHIDMLDWLGINKPEEFGAEIFSPNDIHFRDPRKVSKNGPTS